MSDKELSHLEALIKRHRELDLKIKDGYTNYLDDKDLKKMKMEKLHIKDQIEQLQKKVA